MGKPYTGVIQVPAGYTVVSWCAKKLNPNPNNLPLKIHTRGWEAYPPQWQHKTKSKTSALQRSGYRCMQTQCKIAVFAKLVPTYFASVV